MRQRLAHGNKGQIIVIAPLALIAFISMLGLVYDLAALRLLRSEMQNAADAAALAAVWYDPACPVFYASCASGASSAAANTYASLNNSHLVSVLCASPPNVNPPKVSKLEQPAVPTVTVVISCNAGWLGTHLFGLAPVEIWATSTAAIGPVDPATGSMIDFSGAGPYVARLVA